MPGCRACGEGNPQGARFCLSCGALLGGEPLEEVRRTVTILCADVVGSTSLGESLDPEAVRLVMGRYFAAARAAIERHGGAVEKFIGDAVLAVFGVPRVHEDDALRAVRAAQDLRRDLDRLNTDLSKHLSLDLQVRVGVNTGEVVVGSPRAGGAFATGDAVNVAARLEQAAAPGEVLLGAGTYALVRDTVDAAPTPPLRVKGKSEPLRAWRLNAVRQRRSSPATRGTFIGRESEVRALGDAFAEVVQRRTCMPVTVLGAPGEGKTRLAEEFLSRLDSSATVLRGRCLSYGEGATLWPLREAVLQAAGLDGDEPGEQGRARLRELVGEARDADAVALRLSHIAGLEGRAQVPEDLAWAFRELLEAMASRRPLVLVVDDLHWAQPGLLDLLEHVVRHSSGAPILLLLLGRPELLPGPPASSEWLSRRTVRLEPLGAEDVELLLRGLDLPAPVRDELVRAAGGNPLFAEHLVGKMQDEGHLTDRAGRLVWVAPTTQAHLSMPPTIHALLSARLDLLTAPERSALERAAVVGTVFYISALAELADADAAEVTDVVRSLDRKGLVRGVDSDLPGLGPAHAFVHGLVRDAAYEGMAKATRAQRHEQVAEWLALVPTATVPDEIVGSHWEQACLYRRELGLDAARTRELGERAADRLEAAAERLELCDAQNAAALLVRATQLLPEGSARRLEVLLKRSRVLMELGRFPEALEALAEVEQSPIRAFAARGRLLHSELSCNTDPTHDATSTDRVIAEALPVLREAGDHRGLSDAYLLEFSQAELRLRPASAAGSLEQAIAHALRAHDQPRALRARAYFYSVYMFGPTPAEEAISALDGLAAEFPTDLRLRAEVEGGTCLLHAMCGRIAEARRVAERARHDLEAVGQRVLLANLAQCRGHVEELAGDPLAADREYTRGRTALRELGGTSYLSTVAGMHARLLARLGRVVEAEDAVREASATGMAGDVITQALIAQARALLLARAHDPASAIAASQALALVGTTEDPDCIADAHADAATVHAALGHPEECRAQLRLALEWYTRKGNVVRATAMRRALEAGPDDQSAFHAF